MLAHLTPIDPIRRHPSLGHPGIKTILAVILIITLWLPAWSPAAGSPLVGQAYYVSPSGADSNTGLTPLNAWKTIQKCAKMLAGGDSCSVLAGNYLERVQINQSGLTNNPITYKAFGSVTMQGFTILANAITIAGFQITPSVDGPIDGWGIYVEGSSVTLDANTISQALRGGIVLFSLPDKQTANTKNVVKNNILDLNAQVGIEIYGQGNRVEDNKITGTRQHQPGASNPADPLYADGIRFFGNGQRIQGNTIQAMTYQDPENLGAAIACFHTWSDANHTAGTNTVMDRNLCLELESPSEGQVTTGFKLEGNASSNTLRNNIVRAYRVLDAQNSPYLSVINNTFTNDLSLADNFNPAIIHLVGSPNALIDNNIFYDPLEDPLACDLASESGLSADYNITYRSDGTTPNGSKNLHDLWQVNPSFTNSAANDFHLLPLSPAIDRGLSIPSVVDDFDGVKRPQGKGFDIGSIEAPVRYTLYLPKIMTAP